MKKIFKVLICLTLLNLVSSQVMAQQEINNDKKKEGVISRLVYNEKVAVKIDYFGELVLHPGLSLGVDYALTSKKWVTVHWDTELGGYWHRWNNTALFFKSSIGTRFPIKSLFIDLNIGAGYMHSFPAGNIYRRTTDGGVEKGPNRGYSHFMPAFSVLFGFDGTRNHDLPFTIHVGAEAYLQSSFNHIFLPHAAAKIGVTHKFRRKQL